MKYKCKINDEKSFIFFNFIQKLRSYRTKTGRFKTSFAQEFVRLDGDVNIDLAGPLLNASAVVDYQGWLAGYQLAFDTQKSKLTRNNFALGYTSGDFVLHTNV